MLTINEAAVRAGVARGTIYRWLKAGLLTRHQLRTRVRICPEELKNVCEVVPVNGTLLIINDCSVVSG